MPLIRFLSHNLLDRTFLKFLVVGGINTLFGYGVFCLLLAIGLHYSIAVVLGSVLGILFNFQTTGRLVFKQSDQRLIFRFLGVYILLNVLNIGLLKLLRIVCLNMYFNGALVLPITAVCSYLLMKYFVFKVQKKDASE